MKFAAFSVWSSICCLHDTPVIANCVSGSVLRNAGSSLSSPTLIDTS